MRSGGAPSDDSAWNSPGAWKISWPWWSSYTMLSGRDVYRAAVDVQQLPEVVRLAVKGVARGVFKVVYGEQLPDGKRAAPGTEVNTAAWLAPYCG